MSRICGKYCDRKRAYRGLVGGNLKQRGHLEDQGVDGRIILKFMFKNWDKDIYNGLIWLRKMERCRAHVNAVMNFRLQYNALKFLTS